ncbi:hypothetical protein RBA41_01820 [Massilia sp. CCM 9210]|uniref:hypothetical protein n=1 Tax=Massilia scottii TaxID=3057166 RepID=UPI002796948B|nr:hypothetical protein [Massilia sp. CCM 9210]MDQ1812033.1 hypothetical protein [Massilia sp. CCM 9210]
MQNVDLGVTKLMVSETLDSYSFLQHQRRIAIAAASIDSTSGNIWSINMKSNLQYIFDKITQNAAEPEAWGKLDRAALIDLAIAIGAADRGVAITADKARLVAEAVLAVRPGGQADLRQLRAGLNHAAKFPSVANEPHPPTSALSGGRERTGAK